MGAKNKGRENFIMGNWKSFAFRNAKDFQFPIIKFSRPLFLAPIFFKRSYLRPQEDSEKKLDIDSDAEFDALSIGAIFRTIRVREPHEIRRTKKIGHKFKDILQNAAKSDFT